MRKVFSSIRLENAEGVATLLNEHGIQTRITNGRSYKGNRRRGFSYRESALHEVPEAAVWVVRPDDQPQARALLREAGLMDSTRDSFLPEPVQPAARQRSVAQNMARVRVILLAAVVILVMLSLSRSCQPRVAPPALEPAPAPAPATEPDDERHIVPVELSL
ncbi:MAG TPA: pathogenicity-like protein [Chiayiivirga sp.]|nr:pathogenicity-like protein [Chiayiivirga sp.]